jgi:hypothetical protein
MPDKNDSTLSKPTPCPPEVLALLGSWNDDDFPDLDTIRSGYGSDCKREAL